MTSFVSRVNQLDSDLLDKEITKIINEQLANVYKELPPGILSKFQPEIDCALKSLVWFSSIQLNKATFGQQVLAISYQNSAITKNRLILHYLLTICTPYAKDVCALRFVNHLRIQKILQWLDCCWRILTVFNFFRFLKVGVYPSLVDYCLRWNIQSANGQKMRNVGYDYMNRELMWTGFLELLNVTIPLVNLHAMKRSLATMLKPKSELQLQEKQEPFLNTSTKCAICSQRPSLPHHMNCLHVFCYLCLKANVLADPNFPCPICDKTCSGEIFPLKIKFVN